MTVSPTLPKTASSLGCPTVSQGAVLVSPQVCWYPGGQEGLGLTFLLMSLLQTALAPRAGLLFYPQLSSGSLWPFTVGEKTRSAFLSHVCESPGCFVLILDRRGS